MSCCGGRWSNLLSHVEGAQRRIRSRRSDCICSMQCNFLQWKEERRGSREFAWNADGSPAKEPVRPQESQELNTCVSIIRRSPLSTSDALDTWTNHMGNVWQTIYQLDRWKRDRVRLQRARTTLLRSFSCESGIWSWKFVLYWWENIICINQPMA